MELNEIEHKIACNELNAAQVFTQMKQHIDAYDEIAKEREQLFSFYKNVCAKLVCLPDYNFPQNNGHIFYAIDYLKDRS